jgi:DNA adenine methylase
MSIKSLNSPFLKWAGGKFRIANTILEYIPPAFSGKYIEPFVGAGAIALNVSTPNVIINDSNNDLILLWKSIQSNVDLLISECEVLFNNTSTDFYKLRNEFNNEASGIRKAALFVYLNRYCFNGLCRYNKSGKFNVPVGKHKTIYFPKYELLNAAGISNNWIIHNKDFREVMSEANSDDFVYCDPPYVPISKTSYFTNYSPNDFNWQDQVDLAINASNAANRGATVLISNHFLRETEELYKKYGAELKIIEVSRTISANASGRNKIKELVALFKKKQIS